MAFNHDLAAILLDDRDRDFARFFAGRESEIGEFKRALREAGRSKQAVFRIFQGAPGCGKTSLAAHLESVCGAEALFVQVGIEDLASRDALAARVRAVAVRAPPMWSKIAANALESLGSSLKMPPIAQAGDSLAGRAERSSTIVLHLDEAQVVDATVATVLGGLHSRGMDVPAVCLCTGLSHTEDAIRALAGMSRLAEEATTNMGRMDDAECIESTLAMLTALRADGDELDRHRVASRVAELSLGWPQHLHCAQQALCRELVRTGGAIEEARTKAVRKESERRRFRYYEARVRGTALAEWPELTAGVADAVHRHKPRLKRKLFEMCLSEIERQRLREHPAFDVHPRDFVDLMVTKGVVAYAPDGRLEMAIPSMAKWLAERH